MFICIDIVMKTESNIITLTDFWIEKLKEVKEIKHTDKDGREFIFKYKKRHDDN